MNENWTWRERPIHGGPAAVVDVDGVVSDAWHRQALARDRRWDEFFDQCALDPPIPATLALLEALRHDLTVVLLTARPGRVRDITLRWLQVHHVRWDLLIMRTGRNNTSARQYKESELDRLRERGFELLCAFEDDPRNVEAFEAAGVRCVYIHSGYYDR